MMLVISEDFNRGDNYHGQSKSNATAQEATHSTTDACTGKKS